MRREKLEDKVVKYGTRMLYIIILIWICAIGCKVMIESNQKIEIDVGKEKKVYDNNRVRGR